MSMWAGLEGQKSVVNKWCHVSSAKPLHGSTHPGCSFKDLDTHHEHRAGSVCQRLGWWGTIAVTRMCDHFLQLVKLHVGSHQWSIQRGWLPTMGRPSSWCHCLLAFKHVPSSCIPCLFLLGEFPQRQPSGNLKPPVLCLFAPLCVKNHHLSDWSLGSQSLLLPHESSSSCQFLSDIGCKHYETGMCA